MANDLHFKVLIAGDVGTGKSTFLKKFENHEIEVQRNLGVDIHTLQFKTSRFNINFQCWDPSGTEVDDDYYHGGDCAVLMLDVTKLESDRNLVMWFQNIKSNLPDAKMVVIGNKVDETNIKCVFRDKVKVMKGVKGAKDIEYFEMSSFINYNVDKPFLNLAQRLTSDKSIRFVNLQLSPPQKYVPLKKLRNNRRQSHADAVRTDDSSSTYEDESEVEELSKAEPGKGKKRASASKKKASKKQAKLTTLEKDGNKGSGGIGMAADGNKGSGGVWKGRTRSSGTFTEGGLDSHAKAKHGSGE